MATPPQEVELGLATTTSLLGGDYTDPDDFSDAWRWVFAETVRVLVGRGVSRAAAEDAVQEAGTRAWSRSVPFTDPDDLARWVTTVAWRISVDEHRRHGRRTSAPTRALADLVAADDVAHTVESRLDLGRALAAWPQLSDADRAALVDAPVSGADRRHAVKHAVRRHRARARLVALMEAVGAVLVAVLGRGRRAGAAVAMAVVPVAAAFLVHAGGSGDGHPPSRPPAPPPTSTTVLPSPTSAPRVSVTPGAAAESQPSGEGPAAEGRAAPHDEPPAATLDTGVVTEFRSRPHDDSTVACVRLRGGETCLGSTDKELQLSHLDDALDGLTPLP